MSAVATFDPTAFAAAFPEFATVPSARLTFLFSLATTSLIDNTGDGPVPTVAEQTNLCWLLVAHLLTLFGPSVTAGAGSTGVASMPNAPTGRLSSATQGSVSTSFEYNIPQNPSAPWYVQTKYGSMYWLATTRYRSGRIVAIGSSGVGYARDFCAPPVNVPGGV